jgi:hypothetical protein
MNPDEFVFDPDEIDDHGRFVARHPLPFSELETLNPPELEGPIAEQEMFHNSLTMEAQLGGTLAAGLVITGFYEDRRSEEDGNPIRHYLPSVFVVRARREIVGPELPR